MQALFKFEMSVLIQKRHPYTGNLKSKRLETVKNACLHCGDGLGHLKDGLQGWH